MEVLEPGYLAAKAEERRRLDERRRREGEWFNARLAPAGGAIEEAIRRAEADFASGVAPFVADPLEKYAQLYAREVDRLLAAGDVPGARRAGSEAVYYLQVWASHSTSGGEGTARSREAAEMEDALRRRIADAIPDGSIPAD
jgi:hypothetical protein